MDYENYKIRMCECVAFDWKLTEQKHTDDDVVIVRMARDHMHQIQVEVDVMKTDQSYSKNRCVPLLTLQGTTSRHEIHLQTPQQL